MMVLVPNSKVNFDGAYISFSYTVGMMSSWSNLSHSLIELVEMFNVLLTSEQTTFVHYAALRNNAMFRTSLLKFNFCYSMFLSHDSFRTRQKQGRVSTDGL